MSAAAATDRRAVGGLMLAVFLGALEQTVVASALPAIVRELQRIDLLGWTISIYLLATAAATPVIAKLGDLHGRRRLMHACVALFVLGSLACALAPSLPALIAARAVQGVGGAGLIVIAQASVAEIAGARERSRYTGLFAMVWALAGLIGPVLGGLLTDTLGWRAVFWINLPLGALALWAGAPALRRLGAGRPGGRIDLAGTALFVFATCALLTALSWGGGRYAWLSAPVLGGFGLAALGALSFARRQGRSAEPMLPPALLRDAVIGPALLVCLLMYGFYIAVAVLIPAYFQIGHGLPASRAGLLLVPALVSGAIGALWAGRYAARSGDYRRPVLAALPIAMLAALAMGVWAQSLSPLAAALLFAAVGLGTGPCSALVNVIAQNAAPAEQLGAVTGAMAFARTLGAAIVTTAGSALILMHVRGSGGEFAGARLSELAAQTLPAPTRELFRAGFAQLFFATALAMAATWLVYAAIRSPVLNLRPAAAES